MRARWRNTPAGGAFLSSNSRARRWAGDRALDDDLSLVVLLASGAARASSGGSSSRLIGYCPSEPLRGSC